MYALRALLVSIVLFIFICSPAYADMVASSSDAFSPSPELLEQMEYEVPGSDIPMEIYTLDDAISPLSVDSSGLINCVCFDVTISGTEYTLLFPSAYESSLMVDSDGLLWNMSGSSITGRLFQGEFDPTADTGILLYLAPCLGNNFSTNHNYGSPNYIRRYYWSSSDRLSYSDSYVTVRVNDSFHLFHSDCVLDYVIVFLIGCCLICLWKRSGR